MEETNFYFFSTLPQVLSSVIAFIGAFHIFRNQNTTNVLVGNAQNIIDIIEKQNIFKFGSQGSIVKN